MPRLRLARARRLAAAPDMEVEPAANAAGDLTIDRAAGIIRGVSAIQIGEALGHDLLVDAVTLQQTVDLGNAAPDQGKAKGIKCRFTHPGMCADGLGTLLGHATNFRVVGDKAVCDLTFIAAAAASPKGNLRDYVLDLAEQAPADFGLSIVFCGTPCWVLPDGNEIPCDDPSLKRQCDEGSYFAKPDLATTDCPFARVEELEAVDAVDEPAANEDGLFSRKFSGSSSALADAAFRWLDDFRGLHGIPLDTISTFAARYVAARKFHQPALPAATPPAIAEDSPMSPTLLKLAQAHPGQATKIIELFAAKKGDAEIVEAVTTAAFGAVQADLTTALGNVKSLQDQLAAATTAHTEALAKEKARADALAAKVARFEAFEKSGTIDPGSDAGAPAADGPEGVKDAWAKSAEVRTFWKGDFDSFKAACEIDGIEVALANSKPKA